MVSIIITAYNYEKYIERAIRSCLEQSLPKNDFEIIVVNDASTDNTEEILENYSSDVRVFNLEKNVGLSGARNYGIKKSKGQFVVFLDADDYLHRDLLFVEKLFLSENNAYDAVSCDYYKVDERGIHISRSNAEKEPIACGIMFRKDFLYNIGLYDEDFRTREEEDLRIRWEKKYSIYNITLPLYRYRMHGTNMTGNHEEMEIYKQKLTEKHS